MLHNHDKHLIIYLLLHRSLTDVAEAYKLSTILHRDQQQLINTKINKNYIYIFILYIIFSLIDINRLIFTNVQIFNMNMRVLQKLLGESLKRV